MSASNMAVKTLVAEPISNHPTIAALLGLDGRIGNILEFRLSNRWSWS